jgi:hypothetical protein
MDDELPSIPSISVILTGTDPIWTLPDENVASENRFAILRLPLLSPEE